MFSFCLFVGADEVTAMTRARIVEVEKRISKNCAGFFKGTVRPVSKEQLAEMVEVLENKT
jgi:hypothetical protein